MSEPLVKVENLKMYFPITGGWMQRVVGHVKAVDDVSFEIGRGETVGLVGESGCGKSTVARTMLRLYEKTGGKVTFDGMDIFALKREELRRQRPRMQYIFQDPYSSLNPRMNVMQIVGEALEGHNLVEKAELEERVLETMEICGLLREQAWRYPHEFSGGQRQRIGIARALAMHPEFVVADEPVSALDVSIQSQIINLMMDLQQQFGFSYLFISHDLSVVKHISHRVGVMYLGSMVEFSEKKELYENPRHPYTQALLSSVPIPDPTIKRQRIILTGDLPSPSNPPPGCKFHTRCPNAQPICGQEVPKWELVGPEHYCACHFVKPQ